MNARLAAMLACAMALPLHSRAAQAQYPERTATCCERT